MSLLDMPADTLQKIGELVVGEVEAAGLLGVSVIARQVANLCQVCKGLLPLIVAAWASLSNQTPQVFAQLGISEILDQYNCNHLLGAKPYFGPVNHQNHQAPVMRKHSAGLHALDLVERLSLKGHLSSANGPFAPQLPVMVCVRQLQAPIAVKVMVAVEKCQFFWRTPSPLWRCVPGHHLEPIELVRELIFGRSDKSWNQTLS